MYLEPLVLLSDTRLVSIVVVFSIITTISIGLCTYMSQTTENWDELKANEIVVSRS